MQKNFKRAVNSLVVSALALSAAALAVDASAATAVGNMAVGANVVATCTVTSASMTFGPYSAGATTAQLDATGTVSTTCTLDAAATVTLSQGANDAAGTPDAPQRLMTNGAGQSLAYFLFSNAGRTTVWGDTLATSAPTTGTGAAVPLTVYGRITANQNVPAGTYSDTVVATVTF